MVDPTDKSEKNEGTNTLPENLIALIVMSLGSIGFLSMLFPGRVPTRTYGPEPTKHAANMSDAEIIAKFAYPNSQRQIAAFNEAAARYVHADTPIEANALYRQDVHPAYEQLLYRCCAIAGSLDKTDYCKGCISGPAPLVPDIALHAGIRDVIKARAAVFNVSSNLHAAKQLYEMKNPAV